MRRFWLRFGGLSEELSCPPDGPYGQRRVAAGPELLARISPLGWAYILLTGEYRWPKRR